ncbi:unnamed protein product [Closterium sp. NIES-54]
MLVLVDDHSRYALLHAALLLNLRSHPQHSSSSPTEIWSKAKPDAPGLRVWGCKAFVLIPPADRSRAAGKLASRALECVYLGHNRDSPGYLFLHPPSSRLICSIDVVFDESIPYYSTPPPDPLPPPSRPLAWTDTVLPPLLPPAPLLPPVTAPLPPSSSADIYDPSAPASPAHSAAPPPHSPSSSHSPPRPQGQQPQQQQPVQQQSGQQPQHQPVQQQQQQPGQQQQRRATSRSSPFLLLRMHTRSLDKLIGAPPLASIQLLKDSHEEFLNIRQHTPFLASLYLDFLGFPVLGATSTPTIFTPTTFHEAITCTDADKWIAANFLECEAFIRNDSFVDVPLPAEANLVEDKWVFRQRLKWKDLGNFTHYLGMAITRNRPARTITLSQSHYIGQVLEKFEMAQAKPVSTPLPFGHQLAPPTSPSSSHPYAEFVGSLMYAMMRTRPDLAYPISVLARFVGTGRHTTEHWQAAKRVLRYLRGTKDHVLTLGGPSPPLLSGFSDSSWADSQPDRRSSQGYGFTLGSDLESRWLCYLLAELSAPQRCPTLWCDNARTIHLTQDLVYHARSKHIDLRYFFIRELVQQGLLAVRKITAEANLADIFTKALSRPAHSALLRLLGLARPGAP